MAPLSPVEGFDYDSLPLRGHWTPAYVKKALGSEALMKQLFDRANELIVEHQLYWEAFASHRYPKRDMYWKRFKVATILQRELGESIAIENNDWFVRRMCQGVLSYQSESAKIKKVGKKLQAKIKARFRKTDLD